jgi:hypothetical protein
MVLGDDKFKIIYICSYFRLVLSLNFIIHISVQISTAIISNRISNSVPVHIHGKNLNILNYRAFAIIPHAGTKGWPCWCSRQKSLILNWNTNMAAVTSCANALHFQPNRRDPLVGTLDFQMVCTTEAA